ncbi:MAG: peptidyl-prolyl cis-trans isomerase [Deltaproteobacteria bacterium]|nr:peptidyl-prolyl cis-trans isomerase [Deltaproteobacteria bacterium]
MDKAANLYQILYLLLIIIILSAGACNIINKPEEAVITIGDKSISRKEARKEIERIMLDMGITGQDVKDNIKPILKKIIEKRQILEYGKKYGITISEEELDSAVNLLRQDLPDDVFKEMLIKRYIDFEDWKDNLGEDLLLKKIVSTAIADSVTVSFEETKDYYEKHLEEFRHPRMVQIRQIVTKTREDMEKVLELIKNGSSIRELAREYSVAPEAEDEGLMGWVSEGELDETIDSFVFSLKVGEVSKILESPYGFHVFRIIDAKEEGVKAFPEAIKEIESKLSSEKREEIFKKWLEDLNKEFPVSVKEDKILADMDMEG